MNVPLTVLFSFDSVSACYVCWIITLLDGVFARSVWASKASFGKLYIRSIIYVLNHWKGMVPVPCSVCVCVCTLSTVSQDSTMFVEGIREGAGCHSWSFLVQARCILSSGYLHAHLAVFMLPERCGVCVITAGWGPIHLHTPSLAFRHCSASSAITGDAVEGWHSLSPHICLPTSPL